MTLHRIRPASLIRLLGAWRSAAGPAYVRLADGLRLLILDGRLPLGVILPGERDMAAALEISRNTVSAALARLSDEGFLERRQGAGARTRLPEGPGDRGAPPAPDLAPGVLDLASAAPPASDRIHGAFAAALSALPAHLPEHGYSALGLASLRRVIAERYTRRGLPTSPDQVMVTFGAQHGLALLLRLLTGPGDAVAIDHPTYPHAIDAILRSACRPLPIGLPDHGWDIDGAAAAFRRSAPRIAYVIADFHNPTGAWMTPDTREALALAAERARTTLVLDETLIDLWLDAPVEPYAFREPPGVVRLGSTGKSFWGGLRLGWIRADVQMIQALAGRRPSLDLGTPLVEQLAAAHLLADDADALQERRAMLRTRRDHLIGEMGRRLPAWRFVRPAGGLSLWAELPAPVSSALAATAGRYGLHLTAGPRFGVDGVFERFLRIPYTLAPDQLSLAVDRLSAAYANLGPSRFTAHPEDAAMV